MGTPSSRAAGRQPTGQNTVPVVRVTNAAARRGETIEECVLRTLEQYFADLGGAKPHALHEMVTQAVERPLLKFAMDKAGGNQCAAAELLGINRNTLRKKLTDYGITR